MKFVDDLVAISAMDQEHFQDTLSHFVNTEISSVERNLSLRRIYEADEEAQLGNASLIRFLETITDAFSQARDFEKQLSEFDELVREASEGSEEAVGGWERVKNSIESMMTFLAYRKSEHIKDRFSRITEFQITTDVRPVFSMDRKNVSTILYPSILKIETSDDKTYLCEFYEDLLDDLIDELKRTKKKIKLLKASYARE